MKVLSSPQEINEFIDTKLTSYFINGTLYPFLGAGFTKGCQTSKFNVPDGAECMRLMKQLIILENDEYEDILDENDFDQVANLFYQVVPKNSISDFIYKYFTNVKLDKLRNEFINLNWPYIYTLNIDDGIERNSRYRPVLPNKSITRDFLNTGIVFKLHGDANDEITYIKDNEGLIFSRKQYLKSINKNKDLLDIFLEDYTNFNFLLIGCSLNNEIDIEFLLANNEIKPHKITDKIYVTRSAPKGSQKLKLQDFGVNICLVIDDYQEFYKNISDKFSHLDNWYVNPFQKFLINSFKKQTNPEYNKKIILGETELSIIDNQVSIPDFFIDRKILPHALSLLESSNLMFLIGRRVSGKTFFLYSLANSIKNKTVYFFPSKISLDSDFIDRLSELKNSIVIFDSDTIYSYDVEDIYHKISDLSANGLSFIFCINSSDRLMLSVPYIRVIDGEIVELDPFFTINESHALSKGLSRYAIPNFRQRENILNNIIHYKEIYRNLYIDINHVSKQLESKTLKIFMLSAVFDKVYSNVFRALGIDYDNLAYAIDLSHKSIELEHDIESLEFGQHASYKLITNSKSFLFACLGNFILNNNQNVNSAVLAVVDIVGKLKAHERFVYIYKAVIAFDNLNQIFYKKDNKGAINLIFIIYEKLEGLLYQDTHYWMQRAKSIYYLKRENVQELFKAIEYAKKPYYDSKPFSRLNMNACFQISMIYVRITNLQNFKDTVIFKEAVKWTCTTLQENMYDNRVIQDLVEKAKKEREKNEFYKFCNYILHNRNLVGSNEAEIILPILFNFS